MKKYITEGGKAKKIIFRKKMYFDLFSKILWTMLGHESLDGVGPTGIFNGHKLGGVVLTGQ
jgi:hypothetical protein